MGVKVGEIVMALQTPLLVILVADEDEGGGERDTQTSKEAYFSYILCVLFSTTILSL